MITIPVAFILAFITALVLTPPVRRLAHLVGAVDHGSKSSRKVHLDAKARMGGLAIAIGFYLPLVGLLLVQSDVGRTFTQSRGAVIGLFLGGIAIVALGIYDDIVGASAPKKLVVQVAVALALYGLGFRITQVSLPFGMVVELGHFGILATVLWVVGITNALNLIDGLDGLAAGVAFFAGSFMFVMALLNGNILMMLFMGSLVGAVLGFLVFNFNPASIFMGDTGSLFLGYVVAVGGLQTSAKQQATVALLAPILALGLPIMDTLLAIMRRMWRGRSVFQADREHIHHRLMAMGLSHRATVLVLYALCSVFCASAVLVAISNATQIAIILVVVAVIVGAFCARLGFFNLQQLKKNGLMRHNNVELRRMFRDLRRRLAEAGTLEEVWACVVAACRKPLLLARLDLQASARDGSTRAFSWETDAAPTEAAPLVVERKLNVPDRLLGSLAFTWRDGRRELTRDEELTLESIAGAVAERMGSVSTGIASVESATGSRASSSRTSADRITGS